ncbi:unnamed protein product [Ectocarpus fasciculatus]
MWRKRCGREGAAAAAAAAAELGEEGDTGSRVILCPRLLGTRGGRHSWRRGRRMGTGARRRRWSPRQGPGRGRQGGLRSILSSIDSSSKRSKGTPCKSRGTRRTRTATTKATTVGTRKGRPGWQWGAREWYRRGCRGHHPPLEPPCRSRRTRICTGISAPSFPGKRWGHSSPRRPSFGGPGPEAFSSFSSSWCAGP